MPIINLGWRVKDAETRSANERAVYLAVDDIVGRMGYRASIGFFGKYSEQKKGVLIGWEKELGKRTGQWPLTVELARMGVDDFDDHADFAGEYWQPVWALDVQVPDPKSSDDDHVTCSADLDLRRTFVDLLEAVEFLPRLEAAALARYPQYANPARRRRSRKRD